LYEDSNELDWMDIRDSISYNKLRKIIMGYPIYANQINPKLKIFYKDHYISPIIKELNDEGIYITNYHSPYDVHLVKNTKDIGFEFSVSLFEYLLETINNIIDRSRFNDIDDEIIDSLIGEYINNDLLYRFKIYFLYKNNKDNNYSLHLLKNNEEREYKYKYNTRIKDNPFGIHDGDFVSKEHLIEYGKQQCRFYDNNITMYSGYFDDL